MCQSDDQVESTSMPRHTIPLAILGVLIAAPAAAQVYAPKVYSRQIEGQPQLQTRYAAAPRGPMGGGFIEFLFNGTGEAPRQQRRRAEYSIARRAMSSNAVPCSAIRKVRR